MLAQAKHLYVFGQRSNRGPATVFESTLQRYVPPITMLGGESDFLFDYLNRATSEDLLIAFLTFPSYKKTVEVIRFARDKQIPILVITTGSEDNSLCQMANYIIPTGPDSGLLTTLPMVIVVSLLKVPLVRLNGVRAKDTVKELAQNLEKVGIYADGFETTQLLLK